MKAYELLFIVPSNADEQTRAAIMKRIDTTMASVNGVIDAIDEWGKRKLAYEIDGQAEGEYTLIDFHAEPASIEELNRVLRITDGVMRHMIVARTDRE